MMKNKKNQKGFSLLELIIYLGIISIITLIASQGFISLTRGKSKITVKSEVNSNMRFFVEQLRADVYKSSELVFPSQVNLATSSLSLTIDGLSVSYFLDNNRIYRQVNLGTAEAMTAGQVRVDSMSFFRVENNNLAFSKKKVSLAVDLTVSYLSESPDSQFSQSFRTAFSFPFDY